MRTIVQQLLRGKPVEMSEEAKKEAEKEKEKYLSLLPQFRALLSEKEFDALKKQMEDYARIITPKGCGWAFCLAWKPFAPRRRTIRRSKSCFTAGYAIMKISVSVKNYEICAPANFATKILAYSRSKRFSGGIQRSRQDGGGSLCVRSRGVLIRRVPHRADIGVRGGVPFAAGKRVNILPAGAGA